MFKLFSTALENTNRQSNIHSNLVENDEIEYRKIISAPTSVEACDGPYVGGASGTRTLKTHIVQRYLTHSPVIIDSNASSIEFDRPECGVIVGFDSSSNTVTAHSLVSAPGKMKQGTETDMTDLQKNKRRGKRPLAISLGS